MINCLVSAAAVDHVFLYRLSSSAGSKSVTTFSRAMILFWYLATGLYPSPYYPIVYQIVKNDKIRMMVSVISVRLFLRVQPTY